MADTMLVRLKPYNKKKGHVLRRYLYRGIRFQESRGWMRVRNEVADYLKSVHQIPDDQDSPEAFDICSEKEAKAIDKKEKQDARVALPAEDAKDVTEARAEPGAGDAGAEGTGDLTTADLPTSKSSAFAPSGGGKRGRK